MPSWFKDGSAGFGFRNAYNPDIVYHKRINNRRVKQHGEPSTEGLWDDDDIERDVRERETYCRES